MTILTIVVREEDIAVEIARGGAYDVLTYDSWEELLQRLGQGWFREAQKIHVR